MKKFNSLFFLIFFVFFSSDCFDFRDSFVYRHKKKIIEGALFSMFIAKFYSTNKEFENLHYAFTKKINDNKDTDAANQIEKKFEEIVHSMFLLPRNKKRFAILIEKHKLNWTVTRDLITNKLISYQKK